MSRSTLFPGILFLFVFTLSCGQKKPWVSSPFEPVYFETGYQAADQAQEAAVVSQAVGFLEEDDDNYLLILGYTDRSGSYKSGVTRAQDRAQHIRELILQQSGVSPFRVMVKAYGKKKASGDASRDRRVELLLYHRGKKENVVTQEMVLQTRRTGTVLDPAQLSQDGGGGSKDQDNSGGKGESSGTAGAELPQCPQVEDSGLDEMDQFFAKVRDLLDTLCAVMEKVAQAQTNVEEALGVASGVTLSSALDQLATQVGDSISVTMNGTVPSLTVSGDIPPDAQQAVDAIDAAMEDLQGAMDQLPQVLEQSQDLVTEAKTLASRATSVAKDAGLSITEMGKAVKTIKNNVSATTDIPDVAEQAMDAATELADLVGQSF